MKPTRAFVFLPTRCNRGSCGRAFFGPGSRCEKCERIARTNEARRDLREGNRESLGLQPWRQVPKPKRAFTMTPGERQRRVEQIGRVNAARVSRPATRA